MLDVFIVIEGFRNVASCFERLRRSELWYRGLTDEFCGGQILE